MQSLSLRSAFSCASLLSLLILGTPSYAQNAPRKGGGVKHAEAILGKPLTDAQKKAVRAANNKRQQKIKPIQQEYKATVAKVLGLTLAQYEEREGKLRPQGKKGN